MNMYGTSGIDTKSRLRLCKEMILLDYDSKTRKATEILSVKHLMMGVMQTTWFKCATRREQLDFYTTLADQLRGKEIVTINQAQTVVAAVMSFNMWSQRPLKSVTAESLQASAKITIDEVLKLPFSEDTAPTPVPAIEAVKLALTFQN